ncbi:DNA/RNA non-specific endonuclease [Terribacillus saccharophilus]|uniref:DNA/RNA non-specific endonuclease n=1 Tax=Terribacillus saccharophilus TaxID=361277 RepID=UPI003982A1D9
MDVNYRNQQWENTRKTIRTFLELGQWGKGGVDTLKHVTRNLEDASNDVDRHDPDGVVSFSYQKDEDKYQRLYEDYLVLEEYTDKVGNLIEKNIDQPFYEDIDQFVQTIRDASISNHTTKNHIGAVEVHSVPYGYGEYSTYETEKKEINIDDILSGDNYFADQVKTSFEQWKAENPDEDISEEDFRQASVNTRAFEYESIEDDQMTMEFWIGIASAVVIIGATIIFPPAGVILGGIYATTELASAASGKDIFSKRELSTTERWTRGLLAPLDLVGGGKAAKSLAGTASKATKGAVTGNKLDNAAINAAKSSQATKQTPKVKELIETTTQHASSRMRSLSRSFTNSKDVIKARLGEEAIKAAQKGDEAIARMLNMFPQQNLAGNNGMALASPVQFNKLEEGTRRVVDGAGLSGKGAGRLSTDITDSKTFVERGQHFTNGRRNRLKPNIRYQTGEYDYFYETDGAGRIVKFETDNLQLTTREKRLSHSRNTLGKIKGKDHAGHLAADQFGGSPKVDNLVSQLSDVNLKKYKKIEDKWATALKEIPPKEVKVKVDIIYSEKDMRPGRFIVNYTIDGKPGSAKFKNL